MLLKRYYDTPGQVEEAISHLHGQVFLFAEWPVTGYVQCWFTMTRKGQHFLLGPQVICACGQVSAAVALHIVPKDGAGVDGTNASVFLADTIRSWGYKRVTVSERKPSHFLNKPVNPPKKRRPRKKGGAK